VIIDRDRLLPVADAPRSRHTIEESLAYDEHADLEDRERDVLNELARSADGQTAFQGLRRRLGLHQQALTRTLRRLERQGAVSRSKQGYSLTVQGRAAVRGQVPQIHRGEILPVLQALLPPAVTADEVADRLARRWFRDLRWYGREDKPGEVALNWLTVDSGSLVRVRFAGGMAVLEVELGRGETLDRFPAAQAVLKAIAELYASHTHLLDAPDDKRTFAA
jgi:DNA-binding Lrp family transcriptional regulator